MQRDRGKRGWQKVCWAVRRAKCPYNAGYIASDPLKISLLKEPSHIFPGTYCSSLSLPLNDSQLFWYQQKP